MSEQQAEQTPEQALGEPGYVGAGSTVPHSSEAPGETAAALALSVLESPAIAPDPETPKGDAAKADAPKPNVDAPRIEPAKSGLQRSSGKVLIMSPGDRAWHDHSAEVKVESAEAKSKVKSEAKAAAETPAAAPPRARRGFLATAAMLAFATLAGAIGGALATTGLTHVADAAATTAPNSGALEASIARIDSDIMALKAGLEHTSKTGVAQFNKTTDRLDKIEKAQSEPNARLAKLTEAVDKLRATPAAVPAPAQAATVPPAASKDVTGSVPSQAVAAVTPAPSAAPTPPKPEVGRLPTVEGWTLTDVAYGGALIRGRRGTYEVYAGDFIPGVGRIDAIRKQDGQWVVVTSKGLILSR